MTHMAVYRPLCVMKKVQLSLQNELDLQKSQEILRWMRRNLAKNSSDATLDPVVKCTNNFLILLCLKLLYLCLPYSLVGEPAYASQEYLIATEMYSLSHMSYLVFYYTHCDRDSICDCNCNCNIAVIVVFDFYNCLLNLCNCILYMIKFYIKKLLG